jgi:RNA-splicing ligase RtcB
MITYKGKYNSANVMLDEVEETTEQQIRGFLNHPAFAHTYIAIMPDCHAGAGAVIGYTAKMNDYVIPNVIGVDIGCSILACKMGTLEGKMIWSSSPSLGKGLDDFIKKRIPSGFARRREPPVSKYDDKVIEIIQLANKLELDVYDVLCQLGTLGGGNHFIEVNRDPEDNYWLVIHSGSRNFGLKIATYYQDKAKELMKKMFIEKEEYKNLEFLPLDMGGSEYIEAMKIAQGFASSNRKLMAKMILEGVFSLDMEKVEQIESVHNYINFEDNIVRKGAIQALEGQRVVIPLNMRDGSLIGTGKGNPKWNFSAPHGAGRVLSRKKAKETLTMEEYQNEMSGIYTSCINKDRP